MLGEAARTAARCRSAISSAYEKAIDAIGKAAAGKRRRSSGPGISIKLSALHPRYEYAQTRARDDRAGAAHRRPGPGGEALRASASPSMPRRRTASTSRWMSSRPSPPIRRLVGWDGFGLAVQAYQKRCPRADRLARRHGAPAQAPPDGAPGEGRLLGQRDQGAPGARPRRLSGLHPQGDDRRLLSSPARDEAARRRASLLPRSSPPTTRTALAR